LYTAVSCGHLEIFRALVEAGARGDISNGYGVTALMNACRNGDLEIVKALLVAGAYSSRCDKVWT